MPLEAKMCIREKLYCRFTKEEQARHGPLDWVPFGAGPRNCIGMRLALLTIKIATAQIIKNYRLVKSTKTQVRHSFSISLSHNFVINSCLV